MSLLLCPQAKRPYRTESLHFSEHPETRSVQDKKKVALFWLSSL